MTDFDKLSSEYRAVLDHDVRWSGEDADYFARYKADYIGAFLGGLFRGRILDYGCGIGSVVRFLRERFSRDLVEIVGCDASKESVKKAREEVSGAVFTDDISRIDNTPFDVIIMANILHHIGKKDRGEFLEGAFGALKKGGLVFIFEHNPYNPLTRYIVKRSPIDNGASLITLRDAVKLLRAARIGMCEKKYIIFFPRWMKFLRFLEPLLASIPFGAQYAYVGKLL